MKPSNLFQFPLTTAMPKADKTSAEKGKGKALADIGSLSKSECRSAAQFLNATQRQLCREKEDVILKQEALKDLLREQRLEKRHPSVKEHVATWLANNQSQFSREARRDRKRDQKHRRLKLAYRHAVAKEMVTLTSEFQGLCTRSKDAALISAGQVQKLYYAKVGAIDTD
jgi:hypothetical protein